MKFHHPHVAHGTINHAEGAFPIVDHVVECPEVVARELGLAPAVEEPPATDQDATPIPKGRRGK